MMRVSAKWKYLFNAPFKISDTCCLWMKKKPIAEYVKRTGKKSFIGTMASDSSLRRTTYLRTGCNSLENGTSTPLSIWTEADVWEYLHSKNIPYCSVYDNGEQRTGCIFCMFGMVFDKQRFVRLSKTHPSLHKYCMEQLHLNTVLTYLGYPTGEAPEQEEFKFE
jgi:3'-phosphoadenosine 5'-phosphosulfate sulfotransferase (PAPS reductase)/FAD synthetase